MNDDNPVSVRVIGSRSSLRRLVRPEPKLKILAAVVCVRYWLSAEKTLHDREPGIHSRLRHLELVGGHASMIEIDLCERRQFHTITRHHPDQFAVTLQGEFALFKNLDFKTIQNSGR